MRWHDLFGSSSVISGHVPSAIEVVCFFQEGGMSPGGDIFHDSFPYTYLIYKYFPFSFLCCCCFPPGLLEEGRPIVRQERGRDPWDLRLRVYLSLRIGTVT